MKKKILSVLITAVILTTGCGSLNVKLTTGLSKDQLFKINGSPFSVNEAKLYLTTEKNVCENSFGEDVFDKKIGDTTFKDYIKQNIKDKCAKIKTLNLLAQKRKLELSTDEQDRAKRAGDSYYNSLGKVDKDYLKVTKEDVINAYKEYLLANKVYDDVVKDVNPEISDADAKVIKVVSIYKKTFTMDSEGKRTDYSEDEKQKAENEINDLLSQVNDGADFESLASENTDADKTEYQFGRGEMIQEFEDAAFSLKTGEISSVIKTDEGYYIIKCINDYLENETQTNKAKMVDEAKKEAFNKVYDPFVSGLSSEFNDKVWDEITIEGMKDTTVSNFYTCLEENQ